MSGLAEILGEAGSDELQFDTNSRGPSEEGAKTHFQSEEAEYELAGVDQFVF